MVEVWKRTDISGKRIMEEWTNRDSEDKTWEHSREFFEEKCLQRENYEASGGVVNQFAAANAVEEIQQLFEKKMEMQRVEHAAAMQDLKKQSEDKLDKLTEAVMLLAKAKESAVAATLRADRCKGRPPCAPRQEEYESESSSEEEATPPPRKKKKKATRFTIPPGPGAGKEFTPGGPYLRGMKWRKSWP